jgi:hypothetical protein
MAVGVGGVGVLGVLDLVRHVLWLGFVSQCGLRDVRRSSFPLSLITTYMLQLSVLRALGCDGTWR